VGAGGEIWWCAHATCLEANGPLGRRGLVGVAAATRMEGRVLSSDRQSAAVLLADAPPLLVKWRRPVGWRRSGRAWNRPSRERKEARAALAARARGIPAPVPLAVGEHRAAGRLLGAVLVRPFFEAVTPADRVLAGNRDLVEGLARTLRAWHDAGFRHGDAYPKNVLVTAGGEAWPIGVPAARFVRPGPRLDGARRKDLAQWAAGQRALLGEAEAFAFLDAYARPPGLPPRGRLERWIRPRYDRILEKKARREATRPAREGPVAPRPRPLPADHPPPGRRTIRALDDL
jgi:hypothetical protein